MTSATEAFILSNFPQELDHTMQKLLMQWKEKGHRPQDYVAALLYGAVKSRVTHITQNGLP